MAGPCDQAWARTNLYCKLIDGGFLQNCVVDSGGVRTAAALGPRWQPPARFSPHNPVCCQPRPRLALPTHFATLPRFAGSAALPGWARPDNRGHTGLIYEEKFNQFHFTSPPEAYIYLQINWNKVWVFPTVSTILQMPCICSNLQFAKMWWCSLRYHWSFLSRCYGLWLVIVLLPRKNP